MNFLSVVLATSTMHGLPRRQQMTLLVGLSEELSAMGKTPRNGGGGWRVA
jgi:hypothetical protein